MGRNKLERFRVNAERSNVVEIGKEWFTTIKGKWADFFGNNNELILEVGCGNGDYTTGMAGLFPNKNLVGIDVKGSRIWRGSTNAVQAQLTNTAFLRTQLYQIEDFFAPGEASEIWITFPDPRSRDKEEKHRLTSMRFLLMYKNVLKEGGVINLKTDSDFLYEYTLELLQQPDSGAKNLLFTNDLYKSDLLHYHFGLTTTYERRFLAEGKTIKYLRFNF